MTMADSVSVTLVEPWVSRVRGGLPAIALSDLPAPDGLAPGEPVILRGENFAPVGIGLFDTDAGLWRTMPNDGDDEAFDERFLHRRVHQAVELRSRLGLIGQDTAYRLINGEGDGLPGFWADVYARHVVVYALSPSLQRHSSLLSHVIASELHPRSVISKVRPGGEVPTGKIPYVVEHGAEPPETLVATEGEVKYEVHLSGGLNTGLFADMRLFRRSLSTWTSGKKVLNTFAYTGSFSVVAALSGAKSVTSVDFAAGVLEWAKTNFRLNGIDPEAEAYKFERDDVFEFLKVASRREKRFDVVILDPPSRTTVPGRRWFAKSDYDRLVMHALKVMGPGSILVAAYSAMSEGPQKLESQLRGAARDAGRRFRLLDSIGQPPDYPTQLIHPQSRTLKCFVLLVD